MSAESAENDVVVDAWARGDLVPREQIDALLAEQREQIAKAIEAVRNRAWQKHLREHPLADGKSCPRDYGMHDAYYRAARLARETRVLPPGATKDGAA